MNEKEIDYNLLEVEKGNKRNGIYLKNHIQDQDKRIERFYEENKYLKEDYKRHIDRINELTNRIDKAIEKLKEHKYDLDYEPWSIYRIKGSILFDLVNILKGSDSNE